MIAYNKTSLDNRLVEQQAAEALAAGAISQEEYGKVKMAHPVGFYTPNVFIRIGLFILTVVIIAFSLGLLALITNASNENAFAALFIITGLITCGALEFIVYNKHHFRSGVDDALLWLAMVLIVSGIELAGDMLSAMALCRIVFLLALFGALRFADSVMALVAYAALLGIVFNTGLQLGSIGRTILPFLVMAVSTGIYILSTALSSKERYRHYRGGLTLLTAATLLSFYAAGNYFIVRETSISLLDSPPSAALPLGGLFWILTISLPFLYVARGIQKKDTVFLWTGLALIAAAVFTIRHYYSVLPLEWALVTGGIVMIVLSYTLIKYLRTPRHGFTSEAADAKHILAGLHLESLVIAETFAPTTPTPSNDFQFGGGSGGGGGAGGEY
ncbi:MAG TPA: hypothetical protein VL832_22410 [Puia sp.]|jgi:hypothetical protein|nr:hypothetical protein [Puia sp.]